MTGTVIEVFHRSDTQFDGADRICLEASSLSPLTEDIPALRLAVLLGDGITGDLEELACCVSAISFPVDKISLPEMQNLTERYPQIEWRIEYPGENLEYPDEMFPWKGKGPSPVASFVVADLSQGIRLGTECASRSIPWGICWTGRAGETDVLGWCGSLGEPIPAPRFLQVRMVPPEMEEIRFRVHFLQDALRCMEWRKGGIRLISCPCCARCKVDFRPIAHAVEQAVRDLDKDLEVAVMGCEVNGPGEARMADLGVACGQGVGVVFRKGEIVRRVPEDRIVETLIEEIERDE